jgi:hypothetical protein
MHSEAHGPGTPDLGQRVPGEIRRRGSSALWHVRLRQRVRLAMSDPPFALLAWEANR